MPDEFVPARAEDGVGLVVCDAIARITVGTGRRHNALGRAGWSAIVRAARALATREDVSVVVIEGAGRSFCSGSDITEWHGATPDEVDETFWLMEAALEAVEALPVPSIAAVRGFATGAGCELALCCDLRILSASARMGMPILRLGILPSPAFALRLSAVTGTPAARELLFTGRLVGSEEAARNGLASVVVEDADYRSAVCALARDIAGQPRSGLVATKQVTDIESARLRASHQAPGWRYSDPRVFPDRVSAFLERG
jgi:enoyl-CoA hydratase/carnithine racemase